MTSPAGKRKITSPSSLHKQVLSPALKNQRLDDGASNLGSIIREMRDMEKRLQLHSDQLFGKLSAALNAIEEKLINKIESEIKLITERANEIEDRVASIESDIRSIDRLYTDIDSLKKEIEELRSKEKTSTVGDFGTDAIVFGIPFCEAENLKSIFNQICRYIDYLAPQIRDIFRVRPKSTVNQNNTVVIIKFYTPFDRNRTLKAFSDFRRKHRGIVSMSSAGFECDTVFRIYESLDAPNRKVLQLATKLKRDKKLWSAFSVRGKVYVRLQRNAEAVYVPDEDSLLTIT